MDPWLINIVRFHGQLNERPGHPMFMALPFSNGLKLALRVGSRPSVSGGTAQRFQPKGQLGTKPWWIPLDAPVVFANPMVARIWVNCLGLNVPERGRRPLQDQTGNDPDQERIGIMAIVTESGFDFVGTILGNPVDEYMPGVAHELSDITLWERNVRTYGETLYRLGETNPTARTLLETFKSTS